MDPYGHLERGTGGGISWLFRPRLFTRAVQYYNRICSKFARRTEHTISNWRRTVFSTSVLVSSSYAKWRPRQFRMISLHGSKAELLGNDMVMKKRRLSSNALTARSFSAHEGDLRMLENQ